jgi:hypothetical protein
MHRQEPYVASLIGRNPLLVAKVHAHWRPCAMRLGLFRNGIVTPVELVLWVVQINGGSHSSFNNKA